MCVFFHSVQKLGDKRTERTHIVYAVFEVSLCLGLTPDHRLLQPLRAQRSGVLASNHCFPSAQKLPLLNVTRQSIATALCQFTRLLCNCASSLACRARSLARRRRRRGGYPSFPPAHARQTISRRSPGNQPNPQTGAV